MLSRRGKRWNGRSEPGRRPSRSLPCDEMPAWLDLAQDLAEEMIVEATLRILNDPVSVGGDGLPCRGFTEYRLMNALRQ